MTKTLDRLNHLPSNEGNSPDDLDASILLSTLEDIKPGGLQNTNYSSYTYSIAKVLEASLRYDGTRLLLLVNAIKSCRQPSFKRDVMLEVLSKLEEVVTTSLLSKPLQKNRFAWKELANTVVALPDLVANCNALDKFDNFIGDRFYTQLLKRLYNSLADWHVKSGLSREQKLFFAQIIGRIAFSGYSQLVWQEFTSRVIKEDESKLKSLLVDILTLPLDQSSTQLELFIEPLYIPIFYNLKPTDNGGKYIRFILGQIILSHEMFEYLLCDKTILQTNPTRSKERQEIVLFNIFSYLAELNHTSHSGQSLIVKTLLNIVQSWSNYTKILLRTYEQNRYIGCAFIVAFRFCLNCDRARLTAIASDIQAMIMQAFPTYLNRASSEQRNLAMCVAEIVFPTIHELIMSKSADSNELNFDVNWDSDCLSIKRLYCSSLETLFPVNQAETNETRTLAESVELLEKPTEIAVNETSSDDDELKPYDIDDEVDCDELAIGEESAVVPFYLRDCINGLIENNNARYVKLCLIKTGELISQLSDQANNVDTSIIQTKQNRLEYGKSKPSADDAIRDIGIELAQVLLYLDNQFDIESFEAYRLKALSSLCVTVPDLVVKYLLDNFNETNKSIKQQLDILQVLVASAQQMSGTTNDDEAKNNNKDNKVNKINKFVKYGALYFYGIAHRLKADFNGSSTILPSTIVKAAIELSSSDNGCVSSSLSLSSSSLGTKVAPTAIETNPHSGRGQLRGRMIDERLYKSEDDKSVQLDDSYLLSRILFSISLIIKCLYHQPIMCKLSNDFIDILAAYRCHPDSGVRKAIANSLTIIRDCTPSAYFEEYLKAKTVRLFGSWLAQESELINWPRLKTGNIIVKGKLK